LLECGGREPAAQHAEARKTALVTVNDSTELVVALAEGRPQDVLGTPEAGWVDFKESPYVLDADKGRWELAKDVAAMANAGGGLIVIGIATSRETYDTHDVASELKPFARPLVNVDAYKGVLTGWLVPPQYPSFQWFQSPDAADRHFLVVTVKALPPGEGYALVRRTVAGEGKEIKSFGVPVRRGDDTEWVSAERLQVLIGRGLSEGGLSGGPAPQAATTDSPDLLRARADEAVQRLERQQDWQEEPVLYWQSRVLPAPPALPGLYAADGIRGYLDGQNELRAMGFHFHNPYQRTEAIPGGLALYSRPGLALVVGQDGIVTGGAVADRRLLARSQDGTEGLPLSAIVLAELTYEFFRLVDKQVAPAAPGTWLHRIIARRFQSSSVTLAPGSPQSRWLRSSQPATQDDFDVDFPSIGDAQKDAGLALELVYGLFGLDVSASPYVSERKFDEASFLRQMAER
jgi:hypothetical protein